MYEDIIEHLHEHEKRILLALKDLEKATIEDLQRKTNLNKDSILKASAWAKTKGVVDVKDHVTEFLQLTEEGLEYLREGLPEKTLLRLIEKEPQKIAELKKKFPKLNIALVWINKNDWAKVFKGNLLITEKGRKALEEETKEEKVLRELKDGIKAIEELKVDKETIRNLLRRKLIKKIEKSKKEITLTELGEKVLSELETEKLPAIVREKILERKVTEEKPIVKGVVTQLTPEIIKTGEWKKAKLQKYDVSLPTPKVYPGKRHFMQQLIDYIRKVWLEMGFKEMTGPILEVSFWNFDALFQPQDHPARDLADTLYVKIPEKGRLPNKELVEIVKTTHENGWTTGSMGWQYEWDEEFAKKCVLRTHTTSLSARTLASLKRDIENALPVKYFAVGRVFRNETLDWKHLIEFHQTEGIVVSEDVNFKHLLGYLEEFFTKLGFEKARFRPSYFPYTEMSTEVEIWHPEHKEWVELGGAGIFRPEVVKPLLGIDIPVLAWGLAVERLMMLNYDIEDIRELYWNDIKQLREAKLWLK
jgi:phenylalanyl-tRNA synthetase alpha chain